jgi:hypothetical protein
MRNIAAVRTLKYHDYGFQWFTFQADAGLMHVLLQACAL